MKYSGHVIDSVRFTHGQDSQTAPVTCAGCGIVVPVSEWPAHIGRRASTTDYLATPKSPSKTFSFAGPTHSRKGRA